MKLTYEEECRLEELENKHGRRITSQPELEELQELLDKQYNQGKYKMKTISLEIALGYLRDCAAVIVNNGDRALTYPGDYDLNGDDDNEFLYLSWTNEDGDFNVKCVEGNNRQVSVTDQGTLVFIDDEGEEVELELLNMVPVKVNDKWNEI